MDSPLRDMKNRNFLGRTFDEKTMTWRHKDGSGRIWTEEERQELYMKPTLENFFEIKERKLE